MKITFLGTGASEGIPALFCDCKMCKEARAAKKYHTRSQLLINDDLLIDFPPDTYMHVLQYGVDLGAIKNLIVTHSHSDHLYAEDFWTRGGMSSFELKSDSLNIHGSNNIGKIFDRASVDFFVGDTNETFNGYKIFAHGMKFYAREPFETFEAGEYIVTALPAVHMVREQALNYIVERGGKSLLYALDTGYPKQEYFDFILAHGKRFDAVVVDSTFGASDIESRGHMSFRSAEEFAWQLKSIHVANDDTKFFASHIFHGAAKDNATLLGALPKGFVLPVDGDVFNL